MSETLSVIANAGSVISAEQFHFLRPLWLLSIVPALIIVWIFWREKLGAVVWRGAINKHLIQHLLETDSKYSVRWPWALLLCTWIIAIIAIAGPAWEKLPQPVHQKQDALIIIFDLSLSMLAEDIKPSRLVRARHKILDILNQRNEGLTALIAYSGDAHIVSPLTDDNATVANLVPALSPAMMPVYGSDPVSAMELAHGLFKNAGITTGRVLLLTDSITEKDLDSIDDSIGNTGFELSILGIGTSQGAPIPTQSGFIKDSNGKIAVPQLPQSLLNKLASKNNGRYINVSLDNKDIKFLLPAVSADINEATIATEREFDQWYDRGYLLVLCLLPFTLLAFRRGWLLTLLLAFTLHTPQTSYAFEWNDLWQRADQQAEQALNNGDAKAAANLFKNKAWQAAAQYKAEDYAAAAENLKHEDNADAHYNRANALAKAGKIDEAISAYDDALTHQPEMEDAQFNKALLEKLKQQQQQNPSDKNDKNSEKSDSQKDQQQKNEDSQQQGDKSEQQGDKSEQQGDKSEQQGDKSEQQGDKSEQQKTDSQNDSGKSEKNQENKPQDNDGADLPEDKPAADKAAQDQEKQAKQASAEEDAKQSEQAQQQTSAAQQDKKKDDSTEGKQQAQLQQSQLDKENQQKQQAMEQWLRQIPDEPSGLLKRKFDYEHRLRQQQRPTNQKEQPKW